MANLRDLYQDIIFDHYKAPRNQHPLAAANHQAQGHNPLCGDSVTIYLHVENGVVADASFEGTGCAISTASVSLMTEALKGKKVADVEQLFSDFHDMVTGNETAPSGTLGKLEALAGVREFPARIKCATLAWHTLRAALKNQSAPVTTESPP